MNSNNNDVVNANNKKKNRRKYYCYIWTPSRKSENANSGLSPGVLYHILMQEWHQAATAVNCSQPYILHSAREQRSTPRSHKHKRCKSLWSCTIGTFCTVVFTARVKKIKNKKTVRNILVTLKMRPLIFACFLPISELIKNALESSKIHRNKLLSKINPAWNICAVYCTFSLLKDYITFFYSIDLFELFASLHVSYCIYLYVFVCLF